MADTHEKKIVAALEREVADEVGKEFLAEGHSPHSPEARAERAKRVHLRARAEGLIERGREQLGPGTRAYHVVRRVIVGTLTFAPLTASFSVTGRSSRMLAPSRS